MAERPTLMALEAFRDLVAKGAPPEIANLVVCAAMPTTVAPGDAPRTKVFTISTPSPDRMRDAINPRGWALDNYRKAPRVLWAHDYAQPPIGRALTVDLDG